jgi:hypothetical protein
MSEKASEKAKVAEAERTLAEQLELWEEKMKKADEAKKIWMAAVGISKGRTPLNFHKGHPVVAIKEIEKARESELKAVNPYEGLPLNPDFPKTPLKFYKGHVIGEPAVVVTDHDVKRAAEVEDKGEGGRGEDIEGEDRWYD